MSVESLLSSTPRTDEEFKLLPQNEQDRLLEIGRRAFTIPKTFDEYLATNVHFIQGRLAASNYHYGPIFDQPLDGLVQLHTRHRIFTHDGQSGNHCVFYEDGDGCTQITEQRAYLMLVCEQNVLDKIKRAFDHSTEYVYQWSRLGSDPPEFGNGTMGKMKTISLTRNLTVYPVSRTFENESGELIEEGWTSIPLFSNAKDGYRGSFCSSGISPELDAEMKSGKYYEVDIAAVEWRGGDVVAALLKNL